VTQQYWRRRFCTLPSAPPLVLPVLPCCGTPFRQQCAAWRWVRNICSYCSKWTFPCGSGNFHWLTLVYSGFHRLMRQLFGVDTLFAMIALCSLCRWCIQEVTVTAQWDWEIKAWWMIIKMNDHSHLHSEGRIPLTAMSWQGELRKSESSLSNNATGSEIANQSRISHCQMTICPGRWSWSLEV